MGAGTFITFEGGEGAGKSTQVQLLAERLRSHGYEVVVTREPGGTPFAEQVRALILSPDVAAHAPLSEALLFYAARADHIDKVIAPALQRDAVVLCDRFSDSTRVYQSVAGGLPGTVLERLEEIVVGAMRPAVTIILDIDPVAGLARAEARRGARAGGVSVGASAPVGDKYERQGLAFHEQLRAGFLALAHAEPSRCVVIEGNRPAETIAQDIWRALARRLGLAEGA
ncbi:MAG TPA: dTMP kinase [Hyphomicrobiaceae bacterium]|nr:dTMP kinase [Hyphomicrobiaceae bacterium]